MDSAIRNGAGWGNENEDELSELMDECQNLMLNIIEEKHTDLLAMDFGHVYDSLKSESDSYDPLDRDN